MTARKVDENGYILIENNPITREGVFEYLGRSIGADDPDRVYKVYRPREEIEDPECVNSFKLIPIIDDHEMLGTSEQGLTDAADYGTHGTTGEAVETRDGVMYATLKMFSEKIANALKQGKKDLSLGYRCVYEKAKGTFRGESYDFIQRQLRGNHLALVDEARCNVAVLDHKFTYDSIDIHSRKGKGMEEEKKNAKDEISLETLAEAIQALTAKMDAYMNGGKDADVDVEMETGEANDPVKAAEVVAQAAAEAAAEVASTETGVSDEDEEKKVADEEEKDDKTKPGANAGGALAAGLDRRLKAVEKVAAAMDTRALVKSAMTEITARNELAEKLSHHIGAFDHADKTLDEVAAYGVKKLGLDAKKGQEQAILTGYLAGAARTNPQASAMDSARGKSSIVDEFINGK